MADVIDELRTWLEENWDPDLTVGEWWERLGSAGWAAPMLPEKAYGRNLSRNDAVRVARTIAEHGALGAPSGLGILLAAPTIATHGTQDQIERFVRPIVTGQAAWCQLFSEPGAGSDLAGLQTRAVKDGEEWIVNGQKVWTSGGQVADMGMLIARTDPDVPKHQGITYFAFDMHQPEHVEVRPLREMTGRALFNEVFLTDARVNDDAVIGDVNKGWGVANTTLMFERSGLGSGGGGAGGGATPGSIAGDLQKRAGDLVRQREGGDDPEGAMSLVGSAATALAELAKETGAIDDKSVRQDLAELYALNEIGRINMLRLRDSMKAGKDIPGMPNIAKLSMSEIMRKTRDLGLRILGPYGMLHAYNRDARKALTAAGVDARYAGFTEVALFAQGPPIYGGTDQVQRNIIGERVLGLPKEPGNEKTTAFRDLPKNG
jgi:alkylation response protein AidB-like acyl-CoA dehydrogenase